jgi:hypothetical protein
MKTMNLKPGLEKLVRRADRFSNLSDDTVAAIREIAATEDPDAFPVLARFMCTPGIVGREAALGLYRHFGQLAAEPMRRIVEKSMDEDQIRNAYRVLAALGDPYAMRAVNAHCWADLDEEDAIAAAVAQVANDGEGPPGASGKEGE